MVFQNPTVIFITSMVVILVLLVIPILLSIISSQARNKVKIKSELEQAQRNMHAGIYEEIDKPYASINITAPQTPPVLNFDIEKNIAYVHMSGTGHVESRSDQEPTASESS